MGLAKPTTAMVMGSRFNQMGYTPLEGNPSTQGQWSSGLFDCTMDVSQCCLTCWCPCITFGQNAEIIDSGLSSCFVNGALYGLIGMISGLQCILACAYRRKLKHRFGISQSTRTKDLCTHIWCHPCALCQERRELEHHGYDVPLGWTGNLEKSNGVMGMFHPPMGPGPMSR